MKLKKVNEELRRINIMVTRNLLKEIDKIAKLRLEDRSTAIRQLLYKTLREEKIHLAVQEFQTGNVTFREAASLADLDYWDFQAELEKRGIPLMQDISLAEKRIKRSV